MAPYIARTSPAAEGALERQIELAGRPVLARGREEPAESPALVEASSTRVARNQSHRSHADPVGYFPRAGDSVIQQLFTHAPSLPTTIHGKMLQDNGRKPVHIQKRIFLWLFFLLARISSKLFFLHRAGKKRVVTQHEPAVSNGDIGSEEAVSEGAAGIHLNNFVQVLTISQQLPVALPLSRAIKLARVMTLCQGFYADIGHPRPSGIMKPKLLRSLGGGSWRLLFPGAMPFLGLS